MDGINRATLANIRGCANETPLRGACTVNCDVRKTCGVRRTPLRVPTLKSSGAVVMDCPDRISFRFDKIEPDSYPNRIFELL